MFKKIIWAVDGTITTKRMLPVVRELLEDNNAHLIVVHVQENLTLVRAPLFVDDHRGLDAALQGLVDDLTGQGFDAELVLAETRGSHAAQVMAGLAEKAGADLIVAGSHGQGPVAGFFLGGFTIHLLQHASCPVLVVPLSQGRN